jgi:hypothetical protein
MRMRRSGCLLLGALVWTVSAGVSSKAQGTLDAVRNFSAFRQIDLNRLLAGDILNERGSLMNFPNGISGQTCFAVAVSPEETAKRLQLWDPAPHGELKVYAFQPLHAPCELSDFQRLDLTSRQYPVRWLLEKTFASTPTMSDLNLTHDEAKALAACAPSRADPHKVATCWANLLFARATMVQQKGLAGVAPYELGGERVSPPEQLRAMLLEQPDVVREFTPILRRIGLLEKQAATPSLAPFYYWTLFDADHHGTISLGAVYLLPVDDHYQLADVGYYVSGNYYTAITLYEVRPIQAGGKSGSLVWRGDYFAAPTLAFTKGTERVAYGVLMLQDIKKEIRCFQNDLKKPRR